MGFQNRLSYYQDRRNSKLARNDIKRSGYYMDVIHVQSHRDDMYDEKRMTIEDFHYIPVVVPFDTLEGMETRLGKLQDGRQITHLLTQEESFTLYVDQWSNSSTARVLDRNDLLFWMVENYSDPKSRIEPAAMILRVKNLESHFGNYGIIFQGYTCTTENPDRMPEALYDKLLEAHDIRRAEIRARQRRVQPEP